MEIKTEGSSTKPKRTRRTISLQTKCEVLDRLLKGESYASVGRFFNINESTVRTIKKNEEEIRASASDSVFNSMRFRSRDPLVEKAEEALFLWIQDQSNQNIPVSMEMMKNKMLKIYNHLTGVSSSTSSQPKDFKASNGWLHKFKRRYKIRCPKPTNDSSLTDHQAAMIFCDGFRKFIAEKKYKPQQVFCTGKTNVLWKRMPIRTVICREQRLACKDKIPVIFCSNVVGDCAVKPIFLYKQFNTVRDVSNEQVFCSKNSEHKAFLDWMENCFVSQVEKYLNDRQIEFKILLIVERIPDYPAEELKNFHPDIDILFLPQGNASDLIQPFKQGIFHCFKTNYLRNFLMHLQMELEKKSYLTLSECWKHFTISDCINLVQHAFNEIPPASINACWSKIWEEAVLTDEFPNTQQEVFDIVQISHQIGGEGLEDIDEHEVEELLNYHNEELAEEDLESMISKKTKTNAMNDLTLEQVRNILNLTANLNEMIFQYDPSVERRFRLSSYLDEITRVYKEIEKDMRHSLDVDMKSDVSDEVDIKPAILDSECSD